MIAPRTLVALAVSVLALGACALAKPADAPKVLRLSPSFSYPAGVAAGSVAVAPVTAGGVVAERRYAYVDRAAPGEVRQAATLFWDEPPPRMVERAMVTGLRGWFGSVVGPETSVPTDRRVTIRVDRFEEESGGGTSTARIALDIAVVGAAERKVLLSGRYCGSAPVASAEGSDRARAFEVALADVVGRFARDLAAGAARSGGCSP